MMRSSRHCIRKVCMVK